MSADEQAPPRVGDVEQYWTTPPPEQSKRCAYWLRRIEHQRWRPNKRISKMGYYESSDHFGVYIWEYLNVISPALAAASRRTNHIT